MTAFNALSSADRVDPLFPEGHPLRRLVRPSFDTVRRSLRGMYVATIWNDSAVDPTRAGFRPSYDALYGPGASNVMAFVGTWLSTGPGTEDGGNVVLLPEGIDATLIDYARRIGVLGPFELVPSVAAAKERVARAGKKLYNVDDLGADFDAWSVLPSELSRWVSSKDALGTLTSFGPTEVVKDMYDVSLADFEAAKRGEGRVFLKTSNTESAGLGVYIARTAEEFEAQLATIREHQKRFDLNRRLVVQPEIIGKNRSFQVLLDPRARDEVQVIALTDQLVEADGKTYRSSINHAITRETVEPVGAAILDLVDRIWARAPEAFGFLMSDYFDTKEGPVVYDPGLRPTGNTATAMAAHLGRKLTGRHVTTSLVPLPTGRAGLTFADFARRAGGLCEPESIAREGRALMPWGWNPIQGFGMMIAMAEDQAGVEALRAEILAYRYE
ncbi:Hypothetical protein A7982_04495 [Minicystis rosea]|nr:Hypothetical protein A7982_04495 [Minicystis rosea]